MFDPARASDEYLSAFLTTAHRIWKETGMRPTHFALTCSFVLDGWNSIVEQAVEGYQLLFEEYLNDLSRRSFVQLLLEEEHLRNFPEHRQFAEAVNLLDEELKRILVTEVHFEGYRYWWDTSIPSYGGKEYVDSVPLKFKPFVKLA